MAFILDFMAEIHQFFGNLANWRHQKVILRWSDLYVLKWPVFVISSFVRIEKSHFLKSAGSSQDNCHKNVSIVLFSILSNHKKELNYEEQKKGKGKTEQDWKDFQSQRLHNGWQVW